MRSALAIRLLVFDWDGTLRDSIASIVGCAQAALADVGRHSSDEAIRATVGLGLEEAIRRYCPQADDGECALILERYRHHWLESWHARAALFPGVEVMLERLEAEGYLLAIATGKSRVGLERDFGTVAVRHRFHATRTVDESAPKPSPHMLLELMAELGVEAGETLMIGDTSHDLLMARNAGVAALAVGCGAHPVAELRAHRPRDVLALTTELPDWLARRR